MTLGACSRNLLVFIRSRSCALAQFALLAATLLVAAFGARFYATDAHAPASAAGTVFTLTLLSALAAVACTALSCASASDERRA